MTRRAEESDFYDGALHPEWLTKGGYPDLFRRTAALVPPGQRVVEIGCGAGVLASLLVDQAATYVGLDFSARAIEHARRSVPEATFMVADLRHDALPVGQVYVANEVLEHLEDDLGLLAAIPAGSLVVVSVPSFDSASHVRYFPREGQARRRYAEMLDIDRVEYVPHGNKGRFFHLIRGRR